jgi:hypothetical protein
MTVQEMHTAVKLLLDKADTLNYPNYRAEEIDFFLNFAQDRFVKHRYDGKVSRNKGLEETQKRTDDLRNIISTEQLAPLAQVADNYPNGRFVDLPTSPLYLFSITEQVDVTIPECLPNKKVVKSGSIEDGQLYIVTEGSITYNGITYTALDTFTGTSGAIGGGPNVPITTYSGTGLVYKAETKRMDVRPIQHDDYNKMVRDPFNKPSYSSAYSEVLRVMIDGRLEIIFPDNENIFNSLILRYVREPQRISLTLSTDCELAAHTHQEIVDMAVSSMLENIESGRYKSHLSELSKLE